MKFTHLNSGKTWVTYSEDVYDRVVIARPGGSADWYRLPKIYFMEQFKRTCIDSVFLVGLYQNHPSNVRQRLEGYYGFNLPVPDFTPPSSVNGANLAKRYSAVSHRIETQEGRPYLPPLFWLVEGRNVTTPSGRVFTVGMVLRQMDGGITAEFTEIMKKEAPFAWIGEDGRAHPDDSAPDDVALTLPGDRAVCSVKPDGFVKLLGEEFTIERPKGS